jgi:hypothetical protein
VASATIVAPAGAAALEQARQAAERQALLDGYKSFRSIIDGYAEDPRPSVHDVESVLSVVSGSLASGCGQRTTAGRTSRNGEWENLAFTAADGATVSTFGTGAGVGFKEGRSWYLRLSPGVMGLRCSDENKKERAREREKERERKEAEMSVFACDRCPANECPGHGGSQGEIMEWSARSRSRLSELVGSLDYSEWLQKDGALAMVTLTLPGEWLAVAPDGKTFKKLLKRFEMRWRRNVGPWVNLWKLEFQRRGAPHWHALMRVPALVGRQTFEEWLSATWADVVNHPDPSEREKHLKAGTGVDFSGKDFSDPRRIALYFLGHSAKTTDGKEYQHIVPEEWQKPGKGPGRFWGYAGLASASREIEITEADVVQAARVLRKVKRARAWTVSVLREQGAAKREGKPVPGAFAVEVRANAGQKRGRAAHRTLNKKRAAAAAARGDVAAWQPRFTPSSLGAGGYAVGGWVLVNDALQLGVDVARFFELRRVLAVGSPISTPIAVENRKYARSSQRLPLRGSGLFPRKVAPWMP